MKASEVISALALCVAALGLVLTWLQVRKNTKTKRAEFLRDLDAKFYGDADITKAYYEVEYGKFEYTADFHESEQEARIDKLLSHANMICEFYYADLITESEIPVLEYRLRRIAQNREIQKYFAFLDQWRKQVNVDAIHFDSFRRFSSEKLQISFANKT